MSDEVIISLDLKTYERLKHLVEKNDQYRRQARERAREKKGCERVNNIDSSIKWKILAFQPDPPSNKTVKSN